MKQLRSIASLAIVLLATLPIQAQTENQAFYIYQNDGHFDGFFYDEIEKMTFSFLDTLGVEHDEIVSQEIVTADSTYRIMLSAIDSIGFVQPEMKYNPQVHIKGQDPEWGDFRNIWYLPYEDGEIIVFSLEYTNLEPHVGDVFVDFDIEGGGQNGWSAKIDKLTYDYPGFEGLLVGVCKPIDDITDILQQFVAVEEYGYDDEGTMVRRRVAGRPDLTVGNWNYPKKASRRAEGQWEGDLFNFSINAHIPIYYSGDLSISVDPSIQGKLHLKTTWNLSLFGSKYICIHSKLNFGIGAGFTVDGKIKDFFPGGIGGLLGGVPIPATCPLILLDIAPDAFLRGEAHVNLKLTLPQLNGAMWTKLEINDWVPSLSMGFGNSDDNSKFETFDNEGSGVKMSLNGFVQTGMLFPMKFKSLPVLKKLFDSEIGGQWFVGPKLGADFTLDLTTMPWHDTAFYTQLKNITGQIHMLDADFEVKGTVKTAFSGKKEVTLADGSFSIFPPFDASFAPEFDDAIDYESKMLDGGEIRDCRVISFKPKGYVIMPIDVGVALFDVKEDGTINYEDGNQGVPRSYYHLAELLGQELDKSLWAKYEIPYLIGKSTGDLGEKKRAVPYVSLAGRYFYAPKSYDFNTEPMYEASSHVWEINWDGTIMTPVILTGYIDKIEENIPTYYENPYYYNREFEARPPYYLKFRGPDPLDQAKNSFTAEIDLTDFEDHKFPTNYHPLDTLKYGYVFVLRKYLEETHFHILPFDMQTLVMPCPKDPVLTQIDISAQPYTATEDPYWATGKTNFQTNNPNATIARLERSETYPDGGWHVTIDHDAGNVKLSASFDIVCSEKSNYFEIKNDQLSYSYSYSSEDTEAKTSVSGSFSEISGKSIYGRLDETFSLQVEMRGTYYEKYKDNKPMTLSPLFKIDIAFSYK